MMRKSVRRICSNALSFAFYNILIRRRLFSRLNNIQNFRGRLRVSKHFKRATASMRIIITIRITAGSNTMSTKKRNMCIA